MSNWKPSVCVALAIIDATRSALRCQEHYSAVADAAETGCPRRIIDAWRNGSSLHRAHAANMDRVAQLIEAQLEAEGAGQ